MSPGERRAAWPPSCTIPIDTLRRADDCSTCRYGEGTAKAGFDLVMNTAREIYRDYPAILRALGL